MPNVLSKFFAGQLRLELCHAECHELSHTWNPSCTLAIVDAIGPSLLFCAKTYGSLYFLKALVDTRGRVERIEWRKLLAKTLRSSLFLSATEILFMFWLCAFRRLLGFATWPTISFVNGFLACAVSVWIESAQRRAMIIPYLLNLASEAIYRQAIRRKLLRPLPLGQSLLFGISLGLLVALISQPGQREGLATNRFAASANFVRAILQQSHGIGPKEENGQKRAESLGRAGKLALRNVLLSLGLLSLHKSFNWLLGRNRHSPASPWPSLRLPLFLGTMPLLTRLFHFLLNPMPKMGLASKNAISVGLSSSLAMALFWPNNTLALYAFWKAVELVYYRLVSAKMVPVLPGGDALLFSLVSAYLLGLAVLEPQALRPSYYKFLCSLTGDRLQLFNRPLFDKIFGSRSSGYKMNSNSAFEKMSKLPHSPHFLTINPSLYTTPIHF